MTITSAIKPEFSFVRELSTNTASPTRSFAQRIESGESARNIAQERARSFSETGLLGLHFAHGSASNKQDNSYTKSDSNRPYYPSSAEPAQGDDSLKAAPFGVPVKVAEPSNVDAISSSTRISRAARGLDVTSVTLPLSSGPLSPHNLSVGTKANKSLAARAVLKALSNFNGLKNITLRIVEEKQGLTIFIGNAELSPQVIKKMTVKANEIAKTFGVTVKEIFVINRSDRANGFRG
jgi:hypothetical protein